jgi:hypothetical protein
MVIIIIIFNELSYFNESEFGKNETLKVHKQYRFSSTHHYFANDGNNGNEHFK